MRSLLAGLAFLLTAALSAQQLTPGEPFPLTNTRYGTTAAHGAQLLSNGQDFFLFWESRAGLRVTKIVPGERRVGRLVGGYSALGASVVWTGSYFHVARTIRSGTSSTAAIEHRLVDGNGEPAGEAFRFEGVNGTGPALAANGRRVLMVYWAGGGALHFVTMSNSGALLTPPRVLLARAPDAKSWSSFDVASNGNGFMVVALSASEVYAVTLDGEGNPLTAALVASAPSGELRYAAAASDGRDYLATWTAYDEPARAVFIGADGAVGAPLEVHEPGLPGGLDAAWTGSSYAIVYSLFRPSRVRIVHVDADVRRSLGREEVGGIRQAIGSSGGRTLLAFRPVEEETPISVRQLPLAENHPAEVVTHAAAEQTLLASAAAFDRTLAVWYESEDGRNTVHAGVRTRDGDWQERELLETVSAPRFVTAASNGREFVVTMLTGDVPKAYLLDERGRATGSPLTLPFLPYSIAWNGTSYLLGSRTEAAVATLHPSGVVSPPMRLARDGAGTAVATDGTHTIAAWMEPESCTITCIVPPAPLFVSRLGANLERLDANLFTEREQAYEVAAAWDGRRFVVAWAADTLYYARLNPSAPALPVPIQLEETAPRDVQATAVNGGVAVAWRSGVTHRLAMLGRTGETQTFELDAAGSMRLNAAPEGGIALVTWTPRPDAPHHGSRRVVFALASPSLVAPPDAPELEAELRNGRIRLSWTAPPQPVAGYRVEYKIGDGAWNELEPWFGPDARGTTVQFSIRRNVAYLFRIRAFGIAGPGAYSSIERWPAPKRRAVK